MSQGTRVEARQVERRHSHVLGDVALDFSAEGISARVYLTATQARALATELNATAGRAEQANAQHAENMANAIKAMGTPGNARP